MVYDAIAAHPRPATLRRAFGRAPRDLRLDPAQDAFATSPFRPTSASASLRKADQPNVRCESEASQSLTGASPIASRMDRPAVTAGRAVESVAPVGGAMPAAASGRPGGS